MQRKDWLAFLALGAIWGSSFLWIKIAVQEIGPFTLVAFRLLFGLLGLSVVAAYTRPEFPKQRRMWLILTLIGFTNNALPYVMISWGEQYIDSGVAAILNSTTPLFAMIFAHLYLRDDRLTLPRLVGILAGFAGIVILVSRDLLSGVRINLLAQLAVLLASVLYAGTSVFARKTTRGVSQVPLALIPLIGADLLLWGITPIVESPFTLPTLPITWLAIVWLGLLGTCVAFLLYYYLLHSVGPTRTTLVTYVFPLVGVILGVVFLNELLDWHLLVGSILIVGSILVVNTRG
jgi:drug/metabolite transporter (DMT)-like permease